MTDHREAYCTTQALLSLERSEAKIFASPVADAHHGNKSARRPKRADHASK